MEVKLKKTIPMQIATISHVGPYGEIGKLYEEIAKWLRGKQLRSQVLRSGGFTTIQNKYQQTN